MSQSDPLVSEARADNETTATRLAAYVRGGGLILPLMTALIALLLASLVVALTGNDPVAVFDAIFTGTGFQWLFPWLSEQERTVAAINLQQTLIITTPLILTGLAAAFAFRVGLFNIGGQGQYIMGSIAVVWLASSSLGLPGWIEIVLAVGAGCIAGAAWGAIAGYLKASTGASEVITTIMLNYTALWIGIYLFGLGGPLQNGRDPSLPLSDPISQSSHLPVIWGDPELQGLHIGVFVALAVAGLAWLLLNRSTVGYRIRAVGLNPEAARYGGIGVGRNYVFVMAICGAFAGLAAALDLLGWQFRVATDDVAASQVGYLGIAVALLGRNTVGGTVVAALLFGALVSGTSQRNLDPTVFDPVLASNLTLIIQGLVVLVVTVDLVALAPWKRVTRRLRRAGRPQVGGEP